MTTKLTPINLAILADTDCPSDWERDDLLEFAQEAAREIVFLRSLFGDDRCGDCGSMSACVTHEKITGLYPHDLEEARAKVKP